jgi:zinc protease
VKHYQATWFQPHGATLIVVGDTTLEKVQPLLEARFGHWATPTPPPKVITPLQPATSSTVYLIDKPGALQSLIAVGNIAPPKHNPDELAEEAMVTTLGGAFTSRLNMNLREEKHWAYGAFAFIKPARGPSLFTALAPVQTDKTKESFAEVRRELTEVVGSRPITANELSLAQHNLTLSLPGRWETDRAVGASLGEIAAFGLPDDYYNVYAERISALTPADAERAAKLVVKPSDLTWVIVGDRAKVLGPLESLGLKVIVIDANGKPVS